MAAKLNIYKKCLLFLNVLIPQPVVHYLPRDLLSDLKLFSVEADGEITNINLYQIGFCAMKLCKIHLFVSPSRRSVVSPVGVFEQGDERVRRRLGGVYLRNPCLQWQQDHTLSYL